MPVRRFQVIQQGDKWRIYDNDKGKWVNHPGYKIKSNATQEAAAMNAALPREIKKPKGKK